MNGDIVRAMQLPTLPFPLAAYLTFYRSQLAPYKAELATRRDWLIQASQELRRYQGRGNAETIAARLDEMTMELTSLLNKLEV